MPILTSFSGPVVLMSEAQPSHQEAAMDKADNRAKEKEGGEPDDLSYLDRPTIYTGPRTIPTPPSRFMAWLRGIFRGRAKF